MGEFEQLYPCPCCGYLVFSEPPGSYEICSICFWEDDIVQLRWPDFAGGANEPSLRQSQMNVARFGAMEARFIGDVRSPRVGERPDVGWRPIDEGLDRFEPLDVHERPWPSDGTVLYWWRSTFWLRS